MGRLRRGMGRFLRRVGHLQSVLLLSVIYGVLWMPVGLITRIAADWLHWRAPVRTQWWRRPPRFNDPLHVKDPF